MLSFATSRYRCRSCWNMIECYLFFAFIVLKHGIAFVPLFKYNHNLLYLSRRRQQYQPNVHFFLSIPNTGSDSVTVENASSSPLPQPEIANTSVAPNTTTSTATTTMIEFPYAELMGLQPGSFVVSDIFTVVAAAAATNNLTEEYYNFRIKLYPNGARSRNDPTIPIGFGMSYSIFPEQDACVGVYLQFVPNHPNQSVDISFAIRLIGQQTTSSSLSLSTQGSPPPLSSSSSRRQQRFNLEWRAGMRFVQDGKLANGCANDFGTHLLQTRLLEDFLGIDDIEKKQNAKVKVQVDIQVHTIPNMDATSSSSFSSNTNKSRQFQNILSLRDIRWSNDGNPYEHNTELVRSGRVVVPVLQKLSQRPRMFAQSLYPGVEYRILRIVDPITNQDVFYSRPGTNYELKPLYPLVPQLERSWPITIPERDIPKLYTATMYNIISALGSLMIAIGGLCTAFLLSLQISFYYIPSKSMDPTLQVGDVLLVEKVTPRFRNQYQPGDVVLFTPPPALQELINRNDDAQQQQRPSITRSRDLFVKRVAASHAGDKIQINTQTGQVVINNLPRIHVDLCDTEPLGLIRQYINPKDPSTTITLPPNTLEVLGDCSSVSIDSRVWGPLPVSNVVGRPLVRVWPLSKFGSIGQ